MASAGQHGHEYGRSTDNDDSPDDVATFDAAVHDDTVATANDSAVYDGTSAGPAN